MHLWPESTEKRDGWADEAHEAGKSDQLSVLWSECVDIDESMTRGPTAKLLCCLAARDAIPPQIRTSIIQNDLLLRTSLRDQGSIDEDTRAAQVMMMKWFRIAWQTSRMTIRCSNPNPP